MQEKHMDSAKLLDFAKTLAGQFSNKKQAQENPRYFAHINIYFQPLSKTIFNGPGFYSEQSYNYSPWSPYRQGVHRILINQGIVIVENYQLTNPERLAGAGFKPSLLSSLKLDQINKRDGCSMHFKQVRDGNYHGQIEPGRLCKVTRGERIIYITSQVEFNKDKWISIDEGYDCETDLKVWGSEFGPLQFEKNLDLGQKLNKDWVN